MGKGIDYGLGQTNIDRKTGIRFGVIHSHCVLQAWYDSAEGDYGNPTCPKCGNGARDSNDGEDDPDSSEYECSKYACGDYACDECEYLFDGEEALGDSPNAWILDDGEYKASQSGDGCDIFILSSPYYTRAQFCSPCAPGACHLEHPCEDGERAYCFGHNWFEDGKAPYPVYSVATNELVEPSPKGWDKAEL